MVATDDLLPTRALVQHKVWWNHPVSSRYLEHCRLLAAWVLCQMSFFAAAGGVGHKDETIPSALYVGLSLLTRDRDHCLAGGEGNIPCNHVLEDQSSSSDSDFRSEYLLDLRCVVQAAVVLGWNDGIAHISSFAQLRESDSRDAGLG